MKNLAKTIDAMAEQTKKGEKPKSNSNTKSTTSGTQRNPYYKGSGGTNAGGHGGGGGDDDDSSDDSDEEGNNSDRDRDRDDSEDEDDDPDHNTEKPDDEQVDSKENTKKRDIVKSNFNQAKYITPQCLKVPKISKLLEYFVDKEALTRNDLKNVDGAHGTKRKKPQYSLRVAPWFEKK